MIEELRHQPITMLPARQALPCVPRSGLQLAQLTQQGYGPVFYNGRGSAGRGLQARNWPPLLAFPESGESGQSRCGSRLYTLTRKNARMRGPEVVRIEKKQSRVQAQLHRMASHSVRIIENREKRVAGAGELGQLAQLAL